MNANIHDKVVVASIVDKVRGNRFRWFGYICRRLIDAVVRSKDK